jgi:hypothetical protein
MIVESGQQNHMWFMINEVADQSMLGLLANFANAGYYDDLGSPRLNEVLTGVNAQPFDWADPSNQFRSYNTLNHKVMLLDVPDFSDALDPILLNSVDPTVITGSANWTYPGIKLNDEQMLVIHDQTITYEMAVEFDTIGREARHMGVLAGRLRTHTNRPVNEATIYCDSRDIIGTPFVGAGPDGVDTQTDERGVFYTEVAAGFLRNIRVLDLGNMSGGYIFPNPIWNDANFQQGYNLLPGSSFEINIYLEPIPTNTGTGTGGGGSGGFGG